MLKVLFCVLMLGWFTVEGVGQVIRVPVGVYDTLYTQIQSEKTITIPCEKGAPKNCVYGYPMLSLPKPSIPYINFGGPYVAFFATSSGLYKTQVGIYWGLHTPECVLCANFIIDSFSITAAAYYDSTLKVNDNHSNEFYVFYPDSSNTTYSAMNEDSAFTLYNNMPDNVVVDSCSIDIDTSAHIMLTSQLKDTNKNVKFTIAPFSRSSFDLKINSLRHARPMKDTIFGLIRIHARSNSLDTVIKFSKPFLFLPAKKSNVNDPSEIKTQLKIFPNPTHGILQMAFTTTQIVHLHLHIFNELGKDIMTVYDGMLPEGKRDFSFKLPQGVYYVRMETAEGVLTKKVVVE